MYLPIYCPACQPDLAEIVQKAFLRSCPANLVRCQSFSHWLAMLDRREPFAAVLANPLPSWGQTILRALEIDGSKLIVFGALPEALARHLGIACEPLDARTSAKEDIAASFACPSAPTYGQAASPAFIAYDGPALGQNPFLREHFAGLPTRQACRRYDFTDEWNNLGFGALRADGGLWSLACLAGEAGNAAIASVRTDSGQALSTFAALWTFGKSSLLWFNRPVGPVDCPAWALVERFLAHGGQDIRACVPVLDEIPSGYDAAAVFRLDCDEAIASAADVAALYKAMDVPLSLAVHTVLLDDPSSGPFLRAIAVQGGSILSHSASHPENWGGSYEAALEQATRSRQAILEHTRLENIGVDARYGVSPFHQNPPYAVQALADAGYDGFIGGSIRNDPEYLMARGGPVPFAPEGFIGHSQACMLHGDCLRKDGPDPLAIYKQAMDQAFSTGTLFGLLDHPFSPRYAYGWTDAAQRLNAHETLLTYMKTKGRVLFLSENNAMDWLRYKTSLRLRAKDNSSSNDSPWRLVAHNALLPGWQAQVQFAGQALAPEVDIEA